MINDENNVLTDDELVIARTFWKRRNMHVYGYEMNIPTDLRYRIMYKLLSDIFLSQPIDSFKVIVSCI